MTNTSETPTCRRCGGPLEMIELPDIVSESTYVTNGRCARECWREGDDSIAATRALVILMTAGAKAGKTFDEMVSEHGPQLSDLMNRMTAR